jgi:hypothetical protein
MEEKERKKEESKDAKSTLERYECVGCGFFVSGTLKAFSDGMGAGMRHVCEKRIILCQECMKEIAHNAIDL